MTLGSCSIFLPISVGAPVVAIGIVVQSVRAGLVALAPLSARRR